MPNLNLTYSYYKEIFQEIQKPFAFVDLDLFDANIAAVKARAGDKKVRVASKSVRCSALLKRIFERDVQFQGIMAYHADEAVFLSRQGFDNILIAYPYWDSGQIQAVINEVHKGKTIVSMVDCEDHVRNFSRIAAYSGVEVPLCLDVDMSSDFLGLHFGVYRSGVDTAAQSTAIADFIASQPGVRLDGLMGYEAQIAGVQDRSNSALMNVAVPFLKKRSILELRERRKVVVEALGARDLRFINAGGTGSLESSVQESWVTEVTVGSGFYSPALFDGYSQFRHYPAAAFAIEIVRQPKDDIFTALGGGYVASGSAGKDKLPRPFLPKGMQLIENEGTGEVQTPVIYRGPEKLQLGDPLFFRHAKAGELCERFNQLYLVSEGQIVDTVPTYRGEGQCFM
jgi:D-serine deaminase-like pyridoxal phosphate-dependent protein